MKIQQNQNDNGREQSILELLLFSNREEIWLDLNNKIVKYN